MGHYLKTFYVIFCGCVRKKLHFYSLLAISEGSLKLTLPIFMSMYRLYSRKQQAKVGIDGHGAKLLHVGIYRVFFPEDEIFFVSVLRKQYSLL